MTHLFLCTISPVQDFIRQARKTRDLYAGSRLLSELCRAGILALDKHPVHSELLFPHAQTFSLPHRFLAKLTIHDPNQLQELGRAIEKAIQVIMFRVGQEVLHDLGINEQQPTGFTEQLEQLIQTYWLALPIQDSYLQSFQQLERAMGAIKSHRPFQQYRYSRNSVEAVLVGEMGRKCAIDGERNVKFYQTSQTEGNPMNVLRRKLHLLPDEVCLDPDIPRRYLQAGEGLSAVSFVKRCVHGKHIQQAFPDAQQAFLPPGIGTEVFDAFPSTAAIALQDVLDRIQQATSTDAQALLDFRRHLKHLPGTAGDEQLFYPENHTDAYFRKQQLFRTQNSSQRQQQLAAFESAYAPLNRSLQGLGLHCPSYYAMIRFDGDSMGKWLNGDPAFFQDSSRMETFHQLLSEHLGRFAAWAFDFLNLPAGKAIFAGGDDFLGFVNLDHLFPVLEQLREGFDRMVNQTLKKGLAADGSSVGDVGIRPERNLSFSAGLVVAHYKTPLSIVLQGVQQAEHQAKQFQNSKKDSLHLMILKKSGESLSASCPWYINQQLLSRNLQEIIETLRKPDGFSSSFLRTWYQHLRPMIDDRGKALPDLSEEMILIEGKRLLKRAWMGTSQEQELASQTFMDLLQPLLFYPAEIRNFFQLLFICDFIQRNTNGPRL